MAVEHQKRVEALQEKLRERGWAAYLVTHNVNLYYFTGSMQQGYFWIPDEGEPVYYVKRSVTRAASESSFRVEPLGSFRAWGAERSKEITDSSRIIATEYDVLPVQQLERLQAVLPDAQWQDGSSMVREQRMVKSDEEIDAIRRAAAVIDEALHECAAKIVAGMTELQLMAEIEYAIRRRGHYGIMRMRAYNQELFTGMVAAGAAAAMPSSFDGPAGGEGPGPAAPVGAGNRPLQRNEPILIDIGCCIDGYVIDQTRTAVIGQMPPELESAYAHSERILRATEAMLQPGTVCEELYTQALQLAAEAGLEGNFMGYGQDQAKFLGHGIGLEIDEWPVLARGFRQQLEPGMVVAVEPKFTFPGSGVVGIENTYLITDTGFEKLTTSREGIWRIEGGQA
ncbi:M24 family metallopeptidase [Paenibacillus turpanensis]|uniref:M24 family metallopeptidase n=1 Tax=Paenibacillus turpanensis TaxID=2689078 RepID=UPI001409F27F|nr:Xaa-Pro peptidase family protein [Paenibacillus turpanensis]